VVKSLFKSCALLFLLLVCFAADAAAPAGGKQQATTPVKRYPLRLNDILFKPQEIVRLKLLLKSQFPNVQLNNTRLNEIEVLAKSRQGRGKIALRVGNAISEPHQIPGTIDKFKSTDGDTFRRITIINRASENSGNWQLFIGGYIRIREIVLEVAPLGGEL